MAVGILKYIILVCLVLFGHPSLVCCHFVVISHMVGCTPWVGGGRVLLHPATVTGYVTSLQSGSQTHRTWISLLQAISVNILELEVHL